jgi:hypothetical protein
MHQALVLPGQTAEKNGGVIALQLGEGELDRAVEVVNFLLGDAGFLFEPLALGLKALPEQILGRQDVKQFAVVLRGLDWCDSAHLWGSRLYFELSRNFESVKMSNAIENKVKASGRAEHRSSKLPSVSADAALPLADRKIRASIKKDRETELLTRHLSNKFCGFCLGVSSSMQRMVKHDV